MSLKVCPKCSSWRVLGSENKSLLDRLLQSFNLRRYSCGDCGWHGIGLLKEARTTDGVSPRPAFWRYVTVFLLFVAVAYGMSLLFALIDGRRVPPKSAGTVSAVPNNSNASSTAPAVPPLPEKVRVIGNSDSKRYHLPGMKYYDKVETYHRVEFSSEEEAIAAGYRKAPR